MTVTLKDLIPGQTFYYQAVTECRNNYCKFISITKTPSGRDSFNYSFRGKTCKGKASDRVITVD